MNNQRLRHTYVLGVTGVGKKYRPNSHCHAYLLESNIFYAPLLIKSIMDKGYIKAWCYLILKEANKTLTSDELMKALDSLTEIQPVPHFLYFNEFKSTTEINLDELLKLDIDYKKMFDKSNSLYKELDTNEFVVSVKNYFDLIK